jgi:hypothetical protein
MSLACDMHVTLALERGVSVGTKQINNDLKYDNRITEHVPPKLSLSLSRDISSGGVNDDIMEEKVSDHHQIR